MIKCFLEFTIIAILVIHSYRYCYYYLCMKNGRCLLVTLRLSITHWLDRPVSSPYIIYTILIASLESLQS